MFKAFGALIAFLIFPFFSNALETVKYDVILWGDKIGQMVVTHDVKPDGTEVYTLETHSKAKILWINKANDTRYDVVYKDGKLFSSKHTEIENGVKKRWTNITLDNGVYKVDSYKGKRTFTEVPTYSIVSIYFKDVKNVKRIFYEAEADFDDVEHPEANTWEFKSSDGNRNVYHYENGKLTTTEFHVSIATVKMVLVK